MVMVMGCIRTNSSEFLGIYISRHRNMLGAEVFLRSLTKLYGKHIVYPARGAWYPEAYDSLGTRLELFVSLRTNASKIILLITFFCSILLVSILKRGLIVVFFHCSYYSNFVVTAVNWI
jgi:hypothetical protein